jgi:uncharacterized repeat protein (TIGR03806 family)
MNLDRHTPPSRLSRYLLLLSSVAFLHLGTATAGERPPADAYLGFPASSSVSSPGQWTTEEAFPNLEFNDPTFLITEPGGNRIFVTEREGRVVSFINSASTTAITTVLDIREQTQGDSDAGMLSMAFHPDYATPESANEGVFFVAYSYREIPASPDPSDNLPLQFRISKFRIARPGLVADPDDEIRLIEQLDQHLWHQGGAIFFHPADGFLYISVGDEGGGRCSFNNCQRIDNDLFSGVLRIDVDEIGGDVSHPIVQRPSSGSTGNYYIPNDNPFVGVDGALEEFYALGLRSPHRMTHDPIDDLVWIGDVGQNGREEIDILAPGANYQWNWREGTIPFQSHVGLPDPLVGEWTDPILDYDRTVGATIIGGYVYRGSLHPQLQGKYIYGDFVNGKIFALTYAKEGDDVVVLDNQLLTRTDFRGRTDGITSFGVDFNGELNILTLGEAAKIHRLVAKEPVGEDLPATLSGTGLFQDLASLTPIPALVPYDVNTPLWSDGAEKRRWFSIPTDQNIGYSRDLPWSFPEGSVFVKHFEFALDERTPQVITRLETRVIVAQQGGGFYGATYRWRPDQTDADLLLASQQAEYDAVTPQGEAYTRRYWFPGPTDCFTCHTTQAGEILGIKSRQLKGIPAENSLDAPVDQMQELSDDGFFGEPLDPTELSSIEALASLSDTNATSKDRVRAYLDTNCSHCHGAELLDRAQWDGRYTTPLEEQGIIYGTLLGDYGGTTDFVVRPNDLASSILYLRSISVDASLRMPPIGRQQNDEEFISVLEDWIAETVVSTTTTTLPARPCSEILTAPDRCQQSASMRSSAKFVDGTKGENLVWAARGRGLLTNSGFGDDTGSNEREYFLCIYEGDALVLEASIADTDQLCAGKPCWRRVTERRLRYTNAQAESGEVSRLRIRHSQRSVTRINMRADRAPTLPFVMPVSSQFIVLRNGREVDCVHSELDKLRTNDSDRAVLSGS